VRAAVRRRPVQRNLAGHAADHAGGAAANEY